MHLNFSELKSGGGGTISMLSPTLKSGGGGGARPPRPPPIDARALSNVICRKLIRGKQVLSTVT